jgi:hypothetical protein
MLTIQQQQASRYAQAIQYTNATYCGTANFTKQQLAVVQWHCLLNAWQGCLPTIEFVQLQLVPMLQAPANGSWLGVINVLQAMG